MIMGKEMDESSERRQQLRRSVECLVLVCISAGSHYTVIAWPFKYSALYGTLLTSDNGREDD